MKNIIPVFCVILFCGLSCSAPGAGSASKENPSSRLEGAWLLTKITTTTPDTTTVVTEFDHPHYKLLSGNRWSFGYQLNDSTVMGGGGTFSYDGGDTYTEHIEYHGESEVIGQSITFSIELDSNTWHHVGTLSLKEGKTTFDEIWERVKNK